MASACSSALDAWEGQSFASRPPSGRSRFPSGRNLGGGSQGGSRPPSAGLGALGLGQSERSVKTGLPQQAGSGPSARGGEAGTSTEGERGGTERESNNITARIGSGRSVRYGGVEEVYPPGGRGHSSGPGSASDGTGLTEQQEWELGIREVIGINTLPPDYTQVANP